MARRLSKKAERSLLVATLHSTSIRSLFLESKKSDNSNTPHIMSSERKCALITGITGQDGSYLTELLLEKGYEVGCFLQRRVISRKINSESPHSRVIPSSSSSIRCTALFVAPLASTRVVLITFTRTVMRPESNSSCITETCATQPT